MDDQRRIGQGGENTIHAGGKEQGEGQLERVGFRPKSLVSVRMNPELANFSRWVAKNEKAGLPDFHSLRSANLAWSKRWITVKMIAVETPNMSIPLAASSGPSSLHEGLMITLP